MNQSGTKIQSNRIRNRSKAFLRACDNPLTVERVNAIPFRFQSHDWDYHFDRLASLKFRAAIVGQMGSGKSTLLRQLDRQLNERQYATHFVFLPQRPFDFRSMIENAVAESVRGRILLVDGMERLGYIQRRKFIWQTRNAGLIVTSHQPCRLPTWIHSQTTPQLMSQVLRALGLEQPEIVAAGQTSFDAANGNVRDALRDLYDQFASGRFNDILS